MFLSRSPVTACLGMLLAVGGAVRPATAQDIGRRCQNITLPERGPTTSWTSILQPDGSRIGYGSGGVILLCPTEGIRLVSDSAEYHEAAEIAYLFGNVRYTEGGTAVDARRITYWKRDERILAEGDVVARLENGTRMTGPRADYLRAVPALRPRAQLRATDRPRITLVQRDSTRGRGGGAPAAVSPPRAAVSPPTAPQPPARGGTATSQAQPSGTSGRGATVDARPDTTIVDANTVFMDGDSLIYASGRVVVTRPDLVATSDSLTLDRAAERARFIGNPVMRGSGERSFTLTGSVIDVFSRERRLERVLSRVGAKVVSDDVQLSADTLDLRIRENMLERAFAFGTTRARAISPAQDMTADSIDIYMPGQHIREVRAIGNAMAQSEPDSTRITSTERDWIRGDTVIAMFDSIPPADTTTKPRIRELRSIVEARSFYQIPPDDSASRCPKINYSRGDRITVAFDSQSVSSVLVTTLQDSVLADGVYLECPTAGGGDRPAAGAIPPGQQIPVPPPGSTGTRPPPIARPPE